MTGSHCTETPNPLQSVRESIPVGIRFGDIECNEIDRHFDTSLPKQLSNQAKGQTDHRRKISINGIDQFATLPLNRVCAGLAETFPRRQVTFMHQFIEGL